MADKDPWERDPWESDVGLNPNEPGGAQSKSMMDALTLLLKGANYAGGQVGARIQAPLMGVGRPEDIAAANRGEGPASSEYLTRSGMKPGFGRGALGFGLDIARDPLTFGPAALAVGAKVLPRGVAKVLSVLKDVGNPISTTAKVTGKAAYNIPFRRMDAGLKEMGYPALSKIAWDATQSGKQKVGGKISTISEQIKKLAKKEGEAQKAIIDRIDSAGVTIPTAQAGAYADDVLIKAVREAPQKADEAARIAERVVAENIPDAAESAAVAQARKSANYADAGERAYGGGGVYLAPGQDPGLVADALKALGRGRKEALEQAANSVWPGMGKELEEINSRLSSLLASRRAMKQARIADAGTGGSGALDVASAAVVGANSPSNVAKVWALKRGLSGALTTPTLTLGGRALHAAGRTGLMDEAFRQGVLNLYRPWESTAGADPWE